MKLLTIIALSTLSLTFLNAQTTMCYKENHKSMATIEQTHLDGGLCKGEKSSEDMNSEGWSTNEIKINGMNYIYIFKKQTAVSDINLDALEAKIIKKLQKAEEVKKKQILEETRLANLAAGQSMYLRNCESCHGVEGELNSSNTSRPIINLSLKEFNASIRGYTINDKDQDRGRAIIMKPYADMMTPNDLKNIFSYLQSLKSKEVSK